MSTLSVPRAHLWPLSSAQPLHAHLTSPSLLLPCSLCPSPEARSTSRTSGSRCVASQAMALFLSWVAAGTPLREGARAGQGAALPPQPGGKKS